MLALRTDCISPGGSAAPDAAVAAGVCGSTLFGVGSRIARAGSMQLDAVTARWQVWPVGGVQVFDADHRMARLVVPLAGAATLSSAGRAWSVAMGETLLFAEPRDAQCEWSGGAVGLVFEIGRSALQERCFVRWREPRRLAAMAHVFDGLTSREGIGPALVAFSALLTFRFARERQGADRIGGELLEGLVDALRQTRKPGLFPVVGSVDRVLAALDDAAAPLDDESLARAARITLPNLRRNVRDCTGMTLMKLAQDAWLDRSRVWLSSDREARSIEQIAQACGFTRTMSFARAYRRRFGETPTQTRVSIFARA